MTIQELKEIITIPVVWEELGYDSRLLGSSCKSPFREDRHPSFSVFDNGRRWRDHATGEGGDVIDFYARAKCITLKVAIKLLIDFAREKGYDRN